MYVQRQVGEGECHAVFLQEEIALVTPARGRMALATLALHNAALDRHGKDCSRLVKRG